jgi:hypothetical protein
MPSSIIGAGSFFWQKDGRQKYPIKAPESASIYLPPNFLPVIASGISAMTPNEFLSSLPLP